MSSLKLLLVLALLVSSCTEGTATPPDATVADVPRADAWCAGAADGECTRCPAGWSAVYGHPFDDAHRCVDLASSVGRTLIWCFDPAEMVIGLGLITCYVRPGDGQRFVSATGYPRLEALGWSHCPAGQEARIHPDC